MSKNQATYSPDGSMLYPRRTAFGAVVLEPLDELDRYALQVIEDWDFERRASKLTLRPTISTKADSQAKSSAGGRL